MAGQETFGLHFVFFRQQAAGGIDQASTRRHATRGAVQDALLQLSQFGQRLRMLAPLQVRIAAQGANAAARRIDQHALGLAGQALHAGIVFAVDHDRHDVRQATARETGLGARQAGGRDVEGVEAAGGAHQRAQQQRLAAGARAEIDDHFATARRDQQRQQLAAFVLHFDAAIFELRPAVDCRAPFHADAPRRIRHGHGFVAAGALLQLGQHGVAFNLEGIHAQVQAGLTVQRFDECVRTVHQRQALVQPIGNAAANGPWQGCQVNLRHALEPFGFGGVHALFQRLGAQRRVQAQDGQAARCGTHAAFAELAITAQMAQHVIDGLGDLGAIARAQVGVVTQPMR
ncbi:hypothetical protein D3C86_986260 [compost metagenome]